MTKKTLSLILSLLLTVSIAVTILSGCNDTKDPTPSSTAEISASSTEAQTVGEGAKSFPFSATDGDGVVTNWTVRTDADNVGDALGVVGLVSGTVGDFGLMVDTVNGKTLVYATDQAYWGFCIDGEMASTGVSSTPIEEGKTYSFVYTKS